MCRRRLRSSWLIFLGLIFILGSADCYSAGTYEQDEDYSNDLDSLDYPQQKRNPDMPIPDDRRWMGIGALSNMQQFFESLRENLDSLENLPLEERAALAGKHDQTAEQETRAFRPPATAAYLHAIRNQRPSHRIRNFVANAEPVSLRNSNHYDPSLLWTGLGRRR